MIVTSSGVAGTVADVARATLDHQIDQLRAGGKLEAGKKTLERLEWTKETHSVAKQFEENVDLSLLKDFGVTASHSDIKETIKWVGPIVFSDVLSDPVRYEKSGPGNGVWGILALGRVQLPEYGNSGSKVIGSGEVAYFRESDPIVYRSCGGERGILFYVSNKQS